MGKTLTKIVYSVAEEVSGFELNDDSPFAMLWIEDQIITQNHTLIRKAQTERRLDEMLYMTDDNILVKVFDKTSVIAGIPISNCHEFSYINVKMLLTGLKGAEIAFVSNAGYSIIFRRTSIEKLVRGSSGYYSLGKPEYAILDNTLVFKTSQLAGLKYVSISAIFNDPREVSSWDENDTFKTPSEKNLELLTIQHIDHALQHNPDLFNDGNRVEAAMSQTKSEE